jgi:hypothetical protein
MACGRSPRVMTLRSWAKVVAVACTGCVPPGNASEPDAGKVNPSAPPPTAAAAPALPPPDVMKTPFEDDFERRPAPTSAPSAEASAEATASAGSELGPDWATTGAGIWHIESGRLCGEHAKNHGVWLKRVLPVDARIEFDATSQSVDGDIKAEYWGDGRSFATSLSYTNATSYLTIFGGWHNKYHVLARLNEHGGDRKEITVTPDSDDPREKPVMADQSYHFKVERADGKTIRWWVDGNEMLSWTDSAPLAGVGHDHFGFNDWDIKLCFDNVKVVPLP